MEIKFINWAEYSKPKLTRIVPNEALFFPFHFWEFLHNFCRIYLIAKIALFFIFDSPLVFSAITCRGEFDYLDNEVSHQGFMIWGFRKLNKTHRKKNDNKMKSMGFYAKQLRPQRPVFFLARPFPTHWGKRKPEETGRTYRIIYTIHITRVCIVLPQLRESRRGDLSIVGRFQPQTRQKFWPKECQLFCPDGKTVRAVLEGEQKWLVLLRVFTKRPPLDLSVR